MILPENWTVMNFDVFPDGKYISSPWAGGLDTRMRKCWNGSQQKALRRSHFHFLQNKNAKEIENSHFKEPELWGCKHSWQGWDRVGVSLISIPGTATTLWAWGIICILVSRYSAALLLFCAFSHFIIQQIFIATHRIPSYSLGALDTAKERHSHWHFRISILVVGDRQ